MGKCAICGNNASQLKPLSYEARNTLICPTCYEQILKIRNGKVLDKVLCYETMASLSSRISDLTARKHVDELLRKVEKSIDICDVKLSPEYKEIARKNRMNEEQIRAEERLREERAKKQKIINEKLADYKNFMMTTGYSFDGYAIKKYVQVISGECVLGTGFLSEFGASLADFLGKNSAMFSSKLVQAKEQATRLMVAGAISLEANAIIGVDFDYITLSYNMIGVVTNGTCVVIEPVR